MSAHVHAIVGMGMTKLYAYVVLLSDAYLQSGYRDSVLDRGQSGKPWIQGQSSITTIIVKQSVSKIFDDRRTQEWNSNLLSKNYFVCTYMYCWDETECLLARV